MQIFMYSFGFIMNVARLLKRELVLGVLEFRQMNRL